jgi:Rps23 Pro-64 3,4-dihydroxylase Tpa1-like proline 4-hydroxylase
VAEWIDTTPWDLPVLAERWRAARPFPHLIFDAVVAEPRLAELYAAFEEEPASKIQDDIFEVMASAKDLEHPVFHRFAAELAGPAMLAAVSAITGKSVRRLDMRGYAYLEGHYLLPHADHQAGVGRAIAYAYYLDVRGDLEGGELELFECTLDGGAVVATAPAALIPPARNRLVLFDVSDASLHQVREVTRGMRLSLAGWFYP